MSKEPSVDAPGYRRTRIALLIGILAALLYIQAGNFTFLSYDDNDYVTANPMIQRGIGSDLFRWAFTTGYASHWHPLTWISHAIDWTLFGGTPRGHHFTNVLLHALNSVVLFLAFQRLTKQTWLSACVALLFAVHPMNVQSVAWIAERKNVLSTFFGWYALYLYAGYLERPTRGPLAGVGFVILLGLMSKAMLVTWPMVLLLIDWWPGGRIKASLTQPKALLSGVRVPLLEKLPLLALVILTSAIAYFAMKNYGAIGVEESYPFGVRLQNVVVSYVAYLGKLVVPFSLAAFYPHPLSDLPAWKVAASAVLLVAITIAVISRSDRQPYLAFGWFWYLGTLVPVIGFVQVGEQAMGDRYAYVPYVGLFVAIVWSARDLGDRLGLSSRALGIVFALVTLLLCIRTWDEQRNWRNDTTLWEHAIAVTDDNYIAHQNLGVAYRGQQRSEDAMAQFEAALRVRPMHTRSLVNMGTLLLDAGKYNEGMTYLIRAVDHAPNNAAAQLNLGMGYVRGGEVAKGLEHLLIAVELTPSDYRLTNLLGSVYAQNGQKDKAGHWFEETLRIKPDYDKARANLELLQKS